MSEYLQFGSTRRAERPPPPARGACCQPPRLCPTRRGPQPILGTSLWEMGSGLLRGRPHHEQGASTVHASRPYGPTQSIERMLHDPADVSCISQIVGILELIERSGQASCPHL